MSVARAQEWVARCRAAGIVVYESDGCYSRGNGQSSAYEGWLNHHTATAFGPAPSVLWRGRPDLAGPLCNSAGNADGSVTLVAAHPANHAGASGGWDTAPLPRTSLFNKTVWGHEIVYPGTVPMTPEQYRTASIVSKIGVDIWGYGDVNRIKFHQGTSITGKWDAGYAPGRTLDIAAFRASAITALASQVEVDMLDPANPADNHAIARLQAIANLEDRVSYGLLAGTEVKLTTVLNRLAADLAAVKAGVGALSDDEARIVAAVANARADVLAAVQAGGVDAATVAPVIASALAPILAPMIQAGATPEQVEAAVRHVFADAAN